MDEATLLLGAEERPGAERIVVIVHPGRADQPQLLDESIGLLKALDNVKVRMIAVILYLV